MVERSTDSRLCVFVSSTMAELRDAREIVGNALRAQGIDPWVYETAAGARPSNIEQTCLGEVANADVIVVLFHQNYGGVTISEFRQARELGKPLFVYIRDKEAQRDQQLKEFLEQEVLDLLHGVTYDYFESAVELGQQVARDILSWLVRQYRETTAAIDRGRVSQSEKERLTAEAQRLQQVTTVGLPRGEPLDALVQDVRAWLETLNYGFETHAEYADSYFEWIINVPRRRGYDRILVRGTAGEASLGDVQNASLRCGDLDVDEAWLISASRVSDAARDPLDNGQYRNVLCYTFDELLDEDADFSGYLKWLDQEVQQRGIDRMYVPIAATKDEINRKTGAIIGSSRYDEHNGWLEGYIDKWLDDPSKEHISVLGEFGTGKTWFALHYAWVAARRYKAAKARGVQRPRLPLIIPLRDYAKAVSVESLFSEFFFRRHEIPLPGYSAFDQLNRMGKLLLIFDGFDEMAAKIDRQKMINNFWELARVIVPGSKAVLTCRTEHFPHAQESRDLLNAKLRASTANLTGRPPQFEVIHLAKFDSKQVKKVFELRSSRATADRVMRNPYLLDLARRPVMTEFILDSLPDIEQGKPVDISRVYLYSVRRKMERDITEGRTFTSLADKLFFLCELSWEMLSTDQMSLNYRLFPDRLRRLFGETVRDQKDLDHWHHDMMAQSLLIRNADGDYTPAHRSLLEFFAAYKIAAGLGVLADDFVDVARHQRRINMELPPKDYRWSDYFCVHSRELSAQTDPPLKSFVEEIDQELTSTFGASPITRVVLDLLQPMVRQDDPSVSARILRLIERTRGGDVEEFAYLGGNAATLLAKLNGTAFKGRNLCSVLLAEADLTNADLSDSVLDTSDLRRCKFQNADLSRCKARGASLSGAMFWGTKLEDTDLTGADVTDGQFTEMGAVNAVAFSPEGNMLASGGKDANVHIWNTRDGEELFVLRGHREEIAQLCWSTDSRFIASWSTAEEMIILWAVSSKEAVRRVWSGVPAVPSGSLTLGFSQRGTQIVLKRYGSTDAWTAPCEPGSDGLHYDYSQDFASGVKDSVIIVVDGIRIVRENETIKYAFRSVQLPLAAHEGNVTSVCLYPSGGLGASGSEDATIRYWDLRPFIPETGAEGLPIAGYHQEEPRTTPARKDVLPDWWKKTKPPVPKGMVPNPKFGECLLVIEQKLNCQNLVLQEVKGLGRETLRWLCERGALSPEQTAHSNTARRTPK